SALTEDEAYYWMYSTQLNWGYFDHPPMIALFISAGKWIGGELGVRMVAVLAQVGALWVLWRLTCEHWPGPQRPLLFFGIAFSIVIFQVFGFVATPDSPLLFFAALFLYTYRRLVLYNRWSDALLLGALSAGLLYSKYHGVLLIGFTVLSHPRLLLNPRLYVAGLTGAVLFFPHLWWQYINDFPSFRYHLVERTQEFKWWYVSEFLLNVFLVYNPLLWPMAWRAWRHSNWKDPFTRALAVNFAGFLLFFFLSTFRGHVQPQWTVISSVPMLLMLYAHSLHDARRTRYLLRVAVVVLPLVLVARSLLIGEWAPLPNQFFRPEAFTKKTEALAAGRPVAFSRSYQRASLYAFYTGQLPAFSAGTYKSRRSQFDLWNGEEQLHLRPVLWVGGQSNPDPAFFMLDRDTITYTEIDTFYAFYKVQPVADALPAELKAGQEVRLSLHLYNPYPYELDFSKIARLQIMAVWMDGKKLGCFVPLQCRLPHLTPGASATLDAGFIAPDELPAGRYRVGFSFQYEDIMPFPAGNWQMLRLGTGSAEKR
ncbi:MAG TPA: glycosyltransferase family 39 protein, partial [Saprospiraceae bacterium]|nr:glycosyltransferase family 39 protein [Saprospiraceae bacterium]